jgi:hypothetical protein
LGSSRYSKPSLRLQRWFQPFAYVFRATPASHLSRLAHSLASLQTAINDAATSALFDSFDATKETLNAIEEYRRMAVALLDEIESTGKSHGIKREVEDGGELVAAQRRTMLEANAFRRRTDEPNLAPPSKKYMLHRGLATMDIFTSAASLTDTELAQLAAGTLRRSDPFRRPS